MQARVPEYPAVGEPEALWRIGHLAWASAGEVWPAVPEETGPVDGALLALPAPVPIDQPVLPAPEVGQEGEQLLALPAPMDTEGVSGHAAGNNLSSAPAAQVGAKGGASCLNSQAPLEDCSMDTPTAGEATEKLANDNLNCNNLGSPAAVNRLVVEGAAEEVNNDSVDSSDESTSDSSGSDGMASPALTSPASSDTESASEGDSSSISHEDTNPMELYSDISNSELSEEDMSTDEGSSDELEGAMASDPIPGVNIPKNVAADMGAVGEFNVNVGEGINSKGKGDADALSVLEEAVRLCDRMLAGSQN